MTTIDREELLVYERGRVCDELSRIARLLDTVIIPHVQNHPDDEWAQLVSVKTALKLLARSE